MLRRCLAASLLLLAIGSIVLAETYEGFLLELTDSKVTILVAKGKGTKKSLDLANNVPVSQPKEQGQQRLPFADVKKLVSAAAKLKPVPGILGSVRTDNAGKVVSIELAPGGLPEKAADILEKADKVEFYSLEPEPDEKQTKAPNATRFRGELVLGKTAIEKGKPRTELLNALEVSLGRGRVFKCFFPRHAVRATKGDESVDIVMCFQCGLVYVYFDPKKDEYAEGSIVAGMQPAFDEILKRARVPLAAPMKK